MSTILKALKKLEQDKDVFQAGGLPSGYMGPGSPNIGSRRGVSRFLSPIFRRTLLLILVIGLGGAAAYYYRQARITPPPTIPPIAKKTPSIKTPTPRAARPSTQAKPPVTKASEQTSKFAGPTVADRSGSSATSAAAPQPGTKTKPVPLQWRSLKDLAQAGKTTADRPTPNVNAPVPPIVQKPIQPAIQPNQQPVAPSNQQPAAPSNQQPVAPSNQQPAAPQNQQPVTPPAPKPKSPQTDPYKDTAPLSDGRLKVQAIAWSPQVEDRMAVINTRIVHEGDKVDGFVVTAIRHDDVVVSERGTYYRVAFGRP